MKDEIIQRILDKKLIAILRGIAVEDCVKVADALYRGGIELAEVTFDMRTPDSFPNTAAAITAIQESFDGRILAGAGTVTSPELVDMAASAGAAYIISPNVDVSVIRRTVERGLVSIPGAFTPSEIMTAHAAGADFVKVFPAGNMGPDYIKAVRGPISHVRLLAVGGISDGNAAEFLRAGVLGFGIGGNLVNKKWIESGELEKITETARRLVAAVESA